MIYLYAIYFTFAMIGGALVMNLWRLVVGPHNLERLLALDTLYINAIALFITVGILLDSKIFFEAALLIAMMGFLGTVAFAKYFLRGDIIE